MNYQSLLAVGFLTYCPTQIKKAPIIPAEEPVYKIGLSSNKVIFDVSAFQCEVLFDTNRYAIFNIYIQPIVTYDYTFYWSPKTQGTKLDISNFYLSFNYITSFERIGDSGPIPEWAKTPINSYNLSASIEPPTDTYKLSLENFNYNLDSPYSGFNEFPTIYNGQTFIDKIWFNKDSSKIDFYSLSFIYYARYYNSKNNNYVAYTSQRIRPYKGITTTDDPLRINETIGYDYNVSRVTKIDPSNLDSFNANFTHQGSSSRDQLAITKEGLKTAAAQEYNRGYKDGQINGQASAGKIPWLVSIFNSLDSCLSIEIFPGLKLWYIVALPIVFSLIAFVLSFFR